MKLKVLKGFWSILAVVALLLAAIPSSNAIPVPHGILGTVYDLDGLTQVPAGIDFSINNTANGFFMRGKTGRTGSGEYAASVAGENTDTIVITAWNIEHESTKTLILDGVMRNVTLLLNMTLKPYAPNITSVPATSATEDSLYWYDVDATDYNFDKLTYSLQSAPSGMVIGSTNGEISWTPQDGHIGSNAITVAVSDGNLTSTQNFTITVENINDAPDIVSEPVTTATANQLYSYQVNATDPDNETLIYLLQQAPESMEISSAGLVTWTPSRQDAGNHTIIIQASDGNLSASQLYVLTVKKPGNKPAEPQESPVRRASGGSSFSSGAPAPAKQQRLTLSEDKGVPVKELLIKFKSPVANAEVTVTKIEERPPEVKSIPKRVYTYLEISKENFDNSDIEEATIQFGVARGWLERNKIAPKNIVLSHHRNGKWEDTATAIESEDDNEIHYKSTVNSFSVFAITVKAEPNVKEINDNLKALDNSPKLKETYSIAGYILKSNGKLQVEERTPFSITNLRTNDSVKGNTGIAEETGAFLALIAGNKGDLLLMEVGSYDKSWGTFELTGDMESLAIVVKGNELHFAETNFANTLDNKVTGYITAIQEAPKSVFAALLFAASVAIFLLYRARRRLEGPNDRARSKLVPQRSERKISRNPRRGKN